MHINEENNEPIKENQIKEEKAIIEKNPSVEEKAILPVKIVPPVENIIKDTKPKLIEENKLTNNDENNAPKEVKNSEHQSEINIKEIEKPTEECAICNLPIQDPYEKYQHCDKFLTHKICFLGTIEKQSQGSILLSKLEKEIIERKCIKCKKPITNKLIKMYLLPQDDLSPINEIKNAREREAHQKLVLEFLKKLNPNGVFKPKCCKKYLTREKFIEQTTCKPCEYKGKLFFLICNKCEKPISFKRAKMAFRSGCIEKLCSFFCSKCLRRIFDENYTQSCKHFCCKSCSTQNKSCYYCDELNRLKKRENGNGNNHCCW
jgi:hypothetical protein